MSKEGFDNETIIMNELEGFVFKDLNQNLQDFLQFMFNKTLESNDIIHCSKKAGQNKSDIKITSKGKSHTVSIKSGTGNSVHQEPVEGFIMFLKRSYNISNEFANDLRKFIWGDETLDGSGKVDDRISVSKFKKKYPDVVTRIKDFFHSHKDDLIKRFVIEGPKSTSAPEFIYYGNKENGCWEKSENVLNWLANDNNESNGAVPVGRLTFQAWNRNIKGGNKSEHKRGVIQLKWGSIGEDLDLIVRDKDE
jgi:hypothetical protein